MRRFAAIAGAISLLSGCGPAGPPGAGAVRSTAAPTVAVAPTSSATHPEQSPPEPIGWKLSDLPTFPPAPLPERVVLPQAESAAFLGRIPTNQRVAFLTIDDGFVKTAEAPKLIAAAHIPVTLFLTSDAVQEKPAYFAPMRANGAVIEAHTITHPELRGRSYEFQKHEICGSADRIGTFYGRRPVLFRPPFGDKDATTLRVVKDCGMRAAIFWRETVNEGKVRYQEGDAVQPGDIILMHFRPTFVKDFLGALRAIHRAGLTPALLEDYFTTP
jgi:peptidoglycan/xylan/chitin deacetylase (PgdA/CDA1 family)